MTRATPVTRRGCRPPVRIPFNGHGITPYGMVSTLRPAAPGRRAAPPPAQVVAIPERRGANIETVVPITVRIEAGRCITLNVRGGISAADAPSTYAAVSYLNPRLRRISAMEIRRTASWRLDGGSPTLALNAPSKTLGLFSGWCSAESSPQR